MGMVKISQIFRHLGAFLDVFAPYRLPPIHVMSDEKAWQYDCAAFHSDVQKVMQDGAIAHARLLAQHPELRKVHDDSVRRHGGRTG